MNLMTQQAHWVEFDPSYKPIIGKTVAEIFREGTGFSVRRIYSLPQMNRGVVAEILSGQSYHELNLDMDSLSSPLKYLRRKPGGLGQGLTLEQFQEIWGYSLESSSESQNETQINTEF